MYIFRWLMKNPIIILALYFLSIAAILSSMTGGGTSDKNSDTADIAQVLEAESREVELSGTVEDTLTIDQKDEIQSVESVEVMTVASTDPENTETDVETQFNETDEDELLLMAREAYWNNGLEESAEIYQKLIELNSEVVDYKGELGNVYWRQGFPKKAAELYAEISLPMIREGNADRVANMVGFIGLYFPEKATDIHNRLQAD